MKWCNKYPKLIHNLEIKFKFNIFWTTMEIIIQLWLSITSYFALCSGMDQNVIWMRNSTFEGYNSSSLIRMRVRTNSDCAMRCTVIGTAVAFFHNRELRTCQCMDIFPQALNDLIASPSTTYFIAEGPRCTDGFTYELSIHCCFMIFTEKMNHTDALSACSQHNSSLLRIDNERTHNFFSRLMQAHHSSFHFYVDGSDTINETDWLFSDGSRMSYLPFAPNEPDPWFKDFEDCLVLSYDRNFMLNDIPCEYRYRFICEKH